MDIVVPKERSPEELRQDLIDAVKLLKSAIVLYDNNEKHSFKIIAGQLRLLLCDTKKRKDNSLIPRVFPNPTFHPLSFQMPVEKPGSRILVAFPGTVGTNSNRITEIFDTSANPIPLPVWLDQQILDPTVTIRSLVKSVANRLGGAHVDSELDKLLQKTSGTFINEEVSHAIILTEIARYVVQRLELWLQRG